ncbi:MAG: hypothetical protein DI533_16670 [Cereibacter sphaeroides]|uniref:HTH DNA binding domain-containing protein n=1 Tax=Cereibacter sphaeroides TaxID=1063 RepID=A0A2W5S7P5_CERSP|nr:MAG: hypothetical protein DI533_16670 [Cereibacter sphaeroides]
MPVRSLNHLGHRDDVPPPLPDIGADEEGVPWFLPDDAAMSESWSMPGPRADGRLLLNPGDWRAAQGELAAELAQVCLRFGMLDARIGAMTLEAGQGARQRLALREVADLGWWTGDRIPQDRLALWLGLRAGMADEDAPALARAGWAARRLAGGPPPAAGGWRAGSAAFLGRARDGSGEDLAEVMDAAVGLHPVTEAALLFHAWRIAGQGPATGLEAAVMAARHAGLIGREQALFLPLSMAGVSGLTTTGSTERRLAAWLAGAEQATLSALAQLDRIAAWERQAQVVLADLSGRTPGALVRIFAAWPAVSAQLAEAGTGASRAAIQRNLDIFAARGLIREITGQGRYRFWVAR